MSLRILTLLNHSVPVDRFKAYYQMTHWSLPKLVDFAAFAERAKLEILPHFDFLHLPTFRLDMLATCLAFTLCAIGADQGQLAGVLAPESERVNAWEYGPMVRNEMTIMIMKVSPYWSDPLKCSHSPSRSG